MTIEIRLKKRGRKHISFFDIVATNTRYKRDGEVLDKIGTYDPMKKISEIRINKELALKWLRVGAQISNAARSLLSKAGVMLDWHLEQGLKKNKTTEEKVKEKKNEWEKIASKKEKNYSVTLL